MTRTQSYDFEAHEYRSAEARRLRALATTSIRQRQERREKSIAWLVLGAASLVFWAGVVVLTW